MSNMFKWVRLSAVVALMAVVGASMAQGGGGGQGRGGFGRMGGGGPVGTLMRKDVQDELKITAEQKTKIEALQKEQQDTMRAKMEELRNGGGFDREAMQAEMAKMNATFKKKATDILTPAQLPRFKEINIQLSGGQALLDADNQKELGITDDQKTKLQGVQQSVMQEIMSGGVDFQSMTQEERQAFGKKMQDKIAAEMMKVLTKEQTDKFKTMQGKPFVKKDEIK